MKVFVQTMGSDEASLIEIEALESLASLKLTIAESLAIGSDVALSLILGQEVLSSELLDVSLADCGIEEGATITVVKQSCTPFFVGPCCSQHVFGHFEDVASARKDDYFFERLPDTCTAANTLIEAEVSGCEQVATIRFAMSEPVLKYFRDGMQNGWQPIRDVEVVSGTVDLEKIPSEIWTGDTTNKGWIIAQGDNPEFQRKYGYGRAFASVFANSYDWNDQWDGVNGCERSHLTGEEMVTLRWMTA